MIKNNMKYKTALITGASAGFGKATAKLLAKSGYRLILVARRKEKLEELAKSLDTETYVAQVDVTDKDQVTKFFGELPDDFKDIDVLINNAGLASTAELSQNVDLEDWEVMVDTNIKGVLYFTHHALKGMIARDNGMIVNISSIAATAPYPGGNVYGASKAFVKQLSKNLRADLFGTGIKVTNIEPGAIETEFSEVRYKGDKDKAKAVYEGMRLPKAEDVANTIKWVLEQPEGVNIDSLEIMPIDQTYAGLRAYRGDK
jgi:3-hydroxy acid dehydrogenase/malonic semialdehyde reductase